MPQSQQLENNSAYQDRYLDLQRLSEYSSVAVPTLREHLRRGTLPHFKLRGKILVKRSEFDGWIQQFRVDKRDELEGLVEEAIAAVKH
jgi:excisionase family DNA binding protein